MMVAAIRPDSWNFPLFLHVLGASALVGAVAATTILAVSAQRWPWLRRVAFRTLLLVVIPAWLLMRLAGGWIDSKEDIPGDPTWLQIGSIIGDLGLILIVVATLIGWWSTRRTDRRWPLQAVAALSGVYLVALLVAMFTMSGKPGS
jgi:NADH:ubiquinone oxidoreductase subunit 6 (subunit J)